jgi:hypothetical protein
MPLYVLATMHLKFDAMSTFFKEMNVLVPYVEENFNWSLQGAFTTVLGELNVVYHLWRVPSMDVYLGSLESIAKHEAYARLEPILVSETVNVLTDAPYANCSLPRLTRGLRR